MKRVEASATVTIHGLVLQKKKNGERVYNFAAGDPLLSNHPCIIEGAVRQTEQKYCPYPPVDGIPELRHLVAEWMNANYQTHYSKENVVVTCGGKFGLFALVYSLLETEDEVLIPAPYWVSYPEIVKMGGGTPKIIPTCVEEGWKIRAHDLMQHVTKNSKVLILNNACNPTGVLYTRQEIGDILAAAKELGLVVISDEVYSGLVYEEPGFISCGAFPEYQENVLIVQSCSKNFGMTGWRVGFVLGSEIIIRKLVSLQSQSTTGVSLISQWAAIGALENAQEVNFYVKNAMRKRRDLFITTYNSLFSLPIREIRSALYAFVPLNSLGIQNTTHSVAFCEKVMASANIALVPGSAFGVEGYVRFAFSESEEDIYKGLHLLKQVVR